MQQIYLDNDVIVVPDVAQFFTYCRRTERRGSAVITTMSIKPEQVTVILHSYHLTLTLTLNLYITPVSYTHLTLPTNREV